MGNFKKIAGALVILTAASLMLGQIFDYVAGLTRIVGFIITIVLMSWLAVFVINKLKKKPVKRPATESATSTADDTTTEKVADESEKLDF